MHAWYSASGNWIKVGGDINGDASDDSFPTFGSSVSLSADGTILAIGVLGNGDAGSVQVYQLDPDPDPDPDPDGRRH